MFTHFVPRLFTSAEAADIVRLAEQGRQNHGGLVGGVQHHAIRRAGITWLDDQGPASWVMERIVRGIADANREAFQFDITEFRERLQVASYDESDEGHYDWHSDIGDGPIARQRKLTIVVQLSEPESYEGGALEINLGSAIQPAPRGVGSATLFASFMPHRVTPVTRGRRISLTCWCHGPRFR
ncbi:2OG-Fe(II) oxygenase [Polymorphum gilvum]|uniref:Oxidoreductase domain protein n=1 Tax=Polymorphum gilvum (strain LMG 25793 / CGMCC 1.9160 / SL003B-26A1) TaxID=991905 RepID=F2IZ66_POLGS|nr:2OG-Fe(II) oxygenase [Polymorphum gilvum]ADZ71789.1 Oxidoreductase domain protein [Polymorphum gilvum SL003B-26A1]